MKIRAGRIYAYIEYKFKDRAKKLISGSQWHGQIKRWSWPLSAKARVISVFPHLKEQIEIEEEKYRKSVIAFHEAKKRAYDNLELDTSIYKRAPRIRQIDMIKGMIINDKFALLCEMRTGKTQAVINAYDTLFRQGLVKKCLIVCRKTIMDVWQSEIEISSGYRNVLISGTPRKRAQLISTDNNFYIINYKGLLVLKDYKHWDKFDMVVVDESTHIKNRKTQRTRFALEKLSGARRKYILSGILTPKDPLDAYAQFKFLNPAIFSHRTWGDFKSYYCILEKHTKANGDVYHTVEGYKNLDDMKRRIKYHSIQLKAEDCGDLPKRIYSKRTMELSGELKTQYYDMINNGWIKNKGKILKGLITVSNLKRLHQIVSGAYLKNQKDNLKLLELENIMSETLSTNKQIIIWCEYLESMDLIGKMLRKKGIDYSEIRGATKDRKNQIALFQDGTHKTILCQLETGGMGIDLSAGDTVVYYENPFYDFEYRYQSESRAIKIDKKSSVLYIDLFYKATIDMDIMHAIKTKQNIAKYLVKSFKPGIFEEEK